MSYDNEQTEDVEEAVLPEDGLAETLQLLSEEGDAAYSEYAMDVMRSHEALRDRLEEVRAEREAIERQTVPYTMYDALRRQRDRLREAVREAKNELRVWPGEQLTVDHVQAARDRLSNALDGSEGEEEEWRSAGAELPHWMFRDRDDWVLWLRQMVCRIVGHNPITGDFRRDRTRCERCAASMKRVGRLTDTEDEDE